MRPLCLRLSPCLPSRTESIQPYGDSPLDEEALAETVYLNIINQAQRYVYIYTPYFAVGETMLEALKAAAKRGVDIRLVLPGIPDKKAGLPPEPVLLCAAASGGGAHLRVHARLPPRQVLRQR